MAQELLEGVSHQTIPALIYLQLSQHASASVVVKTSKGKIMATNITERPRKGEILNKDLSKDLQKNARSLESSKKLETESILLHHPRRRDSHVKSGEQALRRIKNNYLVPKRGEIYEHFKYLHSWVKSRWVLSSKRPTVYTAIKLDNRCQRITTRTVSHKVTKNIIVRTTSITCREDSLRTLRSSVLLLSHTRMMQVPVIILSHFQGLVRSRWMSNAKRFLSLLHWVSHLMWSKSMPN